MRKFFKKLFKILAVLCVIFIAFMGFVYVKYSNFDGHCDEVGRVLTEKELIQRSGAKDIFRDNPQCCYALARKRNKGDIENFLDNLFGYYSYDLTTYSKRELPLTHNKNEPFYENHSVIDTCGNHLAWLYGTTITEKDYLNFIKNINN